jgi:hypothetical protein
MTSAAAAVFSGMTMAVLVVVGAAYKIGLAMGKHDQRDDDDERRLTRLERITNHRSVD